MDYIASVNPLWKSRQPEALATDLPSLPLEALQATLVAASGKHVAPTRFDDLIHQLKETLLNAKKTAILARSQSMEIERRQALCRTAAQLFEQALSLKNDLRTLTARMDLSARRRARSLEGAPEWRQIRHQIRRSAELNQLKLSFAA